MLVYSSILEAHERGEVVVAVAIDIQNVFNTLPWPIIREALRRKGFPRYLREIIDGYLSRRSVEFIDGKGLIGRHEVTAGVPQDSVLGPTLWNIGYDSVLQWGTDPGYQVICYADDTLVLAAAGDICTAVARTNSQIGKILNRIQSWTWSYSSYTKDGSGVLSR